MENYKLTKKSVKEKIKYYKEKLQNNYWDLINLISYKIELLGKYIKILDNEDEKIKIKKQIDNLKEKIKIEGGKLIELRKYEIKLEKFGYGLPYTDDDITELAKEFDLKKSRFVELSM
uniref:Uncharacterized protein n=1 Tax=Meloidogyne enterolobii TaxID=390850 RepID=A0A6V7VAG0_MELEN|nr:unnamed protein product [Meloidogyne enterolobii]